MTMQAFCASVGEGTPTCYPYIKNIPNSRSKEVLEIAVKGNVETKAVEDLFILGFMIGQNT